VPAPDQADGGIRVTGQRGAPIQPGGVAKQAACLDASSDRPQVGHERRVYSEARRAAAQDQGLIPMKARGLSR
jgi:hypothetical protein